MTLLTILQRCFSGREIFIPGERVIIRRIVGFDSDYLGVYVHHLCDRDHESLHNHPWKWSAALVLTGWYAEERATGAGQRVRRVVRAGRVNRISRSTFHRIDDVSPKGAWTLCIHGARVQGDGFLTRAAGGWTYRDAGEVSFESTRPMQRL